MGTPRLQYTSRDYDAILADLVAAIVARRPAFDTSPGNPDVALLEALAEVGDRLGYFENRSVNEAFLVRARLRQSVLDHAQALDYRVGSAEVATVDETFTLARGYPDAVTFPAGTAITTEDGSVTYETTEDLTLAAYATTGSVGMREGRTVTEGAVGVAAGAAPDGQRFTTSSTPFLWGSERISVAGAVWTRVDHFLNSTSGDRHYRVEVDRDDRATVVFGDGTNGLRPSEGAVLGVSYRVGGGVRGRVRRERLTRLVGSFVTLGGTPVEVSVTNPADSSGGADRETLAHARRAAPLALRATTRTIAKEDYELHAMEVDGVARALCHTRNEDPGIPWLEHRVYVVPPNPAGSYTFGGAMPSGTLLSDVEDYLTDGKPRGALDGLLALAPRYATTTVSATLRAVKGTVAASLQAQAEAAVLALYDPEGFDEDEGRYLLDFGRGVSRSKLYAALEALPGVWRVELTAPGAEGELGAGEFPALAAAPIISVVVDP